MNKVKIKVASTWISFRVNSSGVLLDTSFKISDFIRSVLYEREWNAKLKYIEVTSKYLWYDKVNMELYIPRYALNEFKSYLGMYGVMTEEINIEPVKPEKIKLSMKPDFQLRSEQIEPAAFLADESVGFRPLALRPGFGKTCLGIHTIVKLGYRSVRYVN